MNIIWRLEMYVDLLENKDEEDLQKFQKHRPQYQIHRINEYLGSTP